MNNPINAVSVRLKPSDFVHEPTFYHPRFCEMLATHMGQGNSFESFASVILIGRSTLYAWRKKYEELYDAYERGISNYIAHWERVAMDGFKGIPPSVWRWNMARVKTMYRDDMEEKVRLQVLKSQLMAEAKNEPQGEQISNTSDSEATPVVTNEVVADELIVSKVDSIEMDAVAIDIAMPVVAVIQSKVETTSNTPSTELTTSEKLPTLNPPTSKPQMSAVEKFIRTHTKVHKSQQRGRSMYHH